MSERDEFQSKAEAIVRKKDAPHILNTNKKYAFIPQTP